MLRVAFKPSFIRQMNKLENDLIDEVIEKIELFKDISNHTKLKVHKLHGPLKDFYSFSVNYKYRIVFTYENKNEVTLLVIGGHDIYK